MRQRPSIAREPQLNSKKVVGSGTAVRPESNVATTGVPSLRVADEKESVCDISDVAVAPWAAAYEDNAKPHAYPPNVSEYGTSIWKVPLKELAESSKVSQGPVLV